MKIEETEEDAVAELGKFNQVDQASPRFFIEFLDLLDSLPALQDVRSRSAAQMRIQPGASVLDIGCGVGTAALGLADRVGAQGRICGIDISDAMVAEATRRAQGRTNAEFRIGNACDLPYVIAGGTVSKRSVVAVWSQEPGTQRRA